MAQQDQRSNADAGRVNVSASADRHIVTVTINRPTARNAIDRPLADQLATAFATLAEDTMVRAVILTGAGEAAFCAGADLRERQRLTAAERGAHTERIADVADRIASLPVPVIAAIRGYALAGGAELALACDLRVAASDAVLGFPEVRIGIFPGAGGAYRLPRLVGLGVASDLLFTGRQIAAGEALRVGLVDRMVPPGDVLETAAHLAVTIAANAPLAVRAVKLAIAEGFGLADHQARLAVAPYRQSLDGTRDYAEGLAAFAERREPRFQGE